MVIYKYLAPDPGGVVSIELPEGAKVVRFAKQTIKYYLWVALDEKETIVGPRRFAVIGTGHKYPPGSGWCGTLHDGVYVWHLIELDMNP